MTVGRLGRPNGLKGFLGLYVEDEDLVHFEVGSVIFVAGEPFTVRALRRGKKGHEVAFNGVDDRPGAEEIRGNDVLARERRDLGEHEFWPDQLVGLSVRPHGGTVIDVITGPAQDRLVVERDGETFEVPFVQELVPDVDLSAGFVDIVEIEGLSSQPNRE